MFETIMLLAFLGTVIYVVDRNAQARKPQPMAVRVK